MKKYIIIGVMIIVAIPLVWLLISAISNPLTRSEEQIRNDLLKVTPIGTSMEDVIAAIEGHEKWKIFHINENRGYKINSDGTLRRSWHSGGYITIGEKSLDVELGKGIITSYVGAWYGFDENSSLIDITIFKELDLP